MPVTSFEGFTPVEVGACPECGSSIAATSADTYDSCDAVRHSSGEVIIIPFLCGKDLAFAIPATPAVTDIEGYLTAGDAIAKLTENYSKPASGELTRAIPYSEAQEIIAKTHNFTWEDTNKDLTAHKHIEQYNLFAGWAANKKLGGFIVINQHDEVTFYVASKGQDCTFSVDNPQEVETGGLEKLILTGSVTIYTVQTPKPFLISGVFASIGAKVNGSTIA